MTINPTGGVVRATEQGEAFGDAPLPMGDADAFGEEAAWMISCNDEPGEEGPAGMYEQPNIVEAE